MSRFIVSLSWILACLSGAVVRAVDSLPVVDLSNDTARQVVIAQGTADVYQGHPTTVLLPDGKTMIAVWTIGHGGTCGPMKRSEDGGKTWSELLTVPENWAEAKNCPSIYRLTGPDGVVRLIVFAGRGPDRQMQQSVSMDDGKTWSPMTNNGLECVMPFTTVVAVEGGKKLIGLSSIRREGDADTKSNVLAQSESSDGGLTWTKWRVLVDDKALKPCEPGVIRSPDGKQLLCMIRENIRAAGAHFITSDDEGKTWSELKPLPASLWGDRHMPRYARDGRLVVTLRDMGPDKCTHNHFVAWVGTYEDIVQHREGQRKLLLLRSHSGSDCGYSGLELLPDDTFVATTYIKYREGPERNSVVSTRFTLAETDKMEPVAAKTTEAGSDGVITLDDSAATYVGDWVESEKQTPLIGAAYRHDNNHDQGTKTATFSATIIDEGEYEVRLLYVATNNRATKVPVTVGEETVMINQREECLVDGAPRALGVYKFIAGKEAKVTISNTDTDGFVVVDGLQIVPLAIAKAERAGERKPMFPKVAKIVKNEKPASSRLATMVALSPLAKKTMPTVKKPDTEEIHLAKDASAAEVNGKHYDFVVVGGTASGVACAVRAAREGLSVLLVQHNRHIGGMLSNGLMQWDALYGGPRSPLFTELLGNIEKHYIEFFGKDSKEHQIARCTHEHYPISWVEPHVMERECNRLVAGEKNITLLLSHYPSAVGREGAMMKTVTLSRTGFQPVAGNDRVENPVYITADMFADATYEGDLFALAKVPYRVGREARDEFGEPHAGKVFTNIAHGPAPNLDITKVNIRAYGSHQGDIDPTSPFTADGAVQAFNYRFCVSNDPDNRVIPDKPANYNREEFATFNRKGIATNGGPNGKSHMNSPILPGENHAYPEASWPEREKIIERHRDFALGLMWFLQNDESVSETQRAGFREWGLPKDEFTDNGHIPYEMYVREARRIVGRHVFKEQDNSLAKDYARTPIMPDAIAITDWYMDSHSCTTDSRPGFHYDGKLILTEESRPAQIPYRALLPQGVDNLLVPLCLSATHIAWGAVRLEPVWMQTGEAAGYAAALSKQNKTTPAALDADLLVRKLVKHGQLVSFFSDVKVSADDERVQAAEYFGTKGFFGDYEAKLDEPVSESVMKLWKEGFAQLKAGTLDASSLAARVNAVAAEVGAKDVPNRGDVLRDFGW